jgi:hypothetical protein
MLGDLESVSARVMMPAVVGTPGATSSLCVAIDQIHPVAMSATRIHDAT